MGAAERIELRQDSEVDEGLERVSARLHSLPAAREREKWCVDDGRAITCMTTRELSHALVEGRITPETRVWRDGFGHWHPIGDLCQLVRDDDEVNVPEQSEIRLRARFADTLPIEPDLEQQTRPARGLRLRVRRLRTGFSWPRARMPRWRTMVAVVSRTSWLATVAGVTVGALAALAIWGALALWFVAHPQVPRAGYIGATVADKARKVATHARERSADAERAWWRARWK